MLESLRLVNFKSWKDTGEIKLAPITAFFGTNSSGKTSLLQALLLLKQTIASSNPNITLDFGQSGNPIVELGSFKETIFNHDETLPLEFSLNWKTSVPEHIDYPYNTPKFKGDKFGFRTQIKKYNGDKASVESLNYVFDKTNFTLEKLQQDKGVYKLLFNHPDFEKTSVDDKYRAEIRHSAFKFYGFPSEVISNYPFLLKFHYELERVFKELYYLGPLRAFPQRTYPWTNDNESFDVGKSGELAIQTILTFDNSLHYKESLSETIAYWLKELDLIHSFRIVEDGSNTYKVCVKTTKESSEVLLTDVGFGVSQIIPVITLCYCTPRGSTLLIEQPEIHLHPKIQAGLADVFIDAIKTRGIQIILESHSEHLLQRLQRRMAEFGLNENGVDKEKINLYFCESKDGASEIKNLILDDYGNITNYPKNFFGDEFGEMAAMAKARIARIQKSKQLSDSL